MLIKPMKASEWGAHENLGVWGLVYFYINFSWNWQNYHLFIIVLLISILNIKNPRAKVWKAATLQDSSFFWKQLSELIIAYDPSHTE